MFQSGDQNWDSEFKMQKISQIENVRGTLKSLLFYSEKIILFILWINLFCFLLPLFTWLKIINKPRILGLRLETWPVLDKIQNIFYKDKDLTIFVLQ